MNNQQLSNTIPPVIDFLAIELNPTVEEARRRASAFVEEARTRLAGLPSEMRLKAIKSLLRELRSYKPKKSSAPWWLELPYQQSFWSDSVAGQIRSDHLKGRIDGLEAQARIISEGFIPTGLDTIRSVRVEGWDAPDSPENDGFSRYERRAEKDNRFIGDNEVSNG